MAAMTPLDLTCHPASPAPVPLGVRVGLERSGSLLTLLWRVQADPASIVWPAPQPAGPADGLWQHTCFEAFIRRDDGSPGYTEFNFSPSGQWACYRFAAERERESAPAAARPDAPVLRFQPLIDGAQLVAQLTLPDPPDDDHPGWRIGLTAVVETAGGPLCWWALHHPAPRPDFHHPGGHVLRLPADRPLRSF